MSRKVVRSEGLVLKCEYSMCGEKYCKLYTVLCDCGVVYRLYMLHFTMSCVYCCSCLVCIVVSCLVCIVDNLCVFVVLSLCIAVFSLDAGLLARSQYSEDPATGHLDAGFSRFPCVYKQMLRWFPRFQVATTCFSCSPSDLNLVVTNFIFCIHVK